MIFVCGRNPATGTVYIGNPHFVDYTRGEKRPIYPRPNSDISRCVVLYTIPCILLGVWNYRPINVYISLRPVHCCGKVIPSACREFVVACVCPFNSCVLVQACDLENAATALSDLYLSSGCPEVNHSGNVVLTCVKVVGINPAM